MLTRRRQLFSVLLALLPLVASGREDLPEVFRKGTPGSLSDLKAMQRHVEALIAPLSRAVVAVQIGNAAAAGWSSPRMGWC